MTAAEYVPEGYIFLSTPNIKTGTIDYDDVNYIPEWRYLESPELMLQPGDVLLVKDGNTLGITNIVKELPSPATVNGSIAILRAGPVEARFLRYVLASNISQGLIGSLRAGMGVPHLFQADIKKMPVPCPSKRVQQAIADYLDAETARMDALIEKKERLLEVLRHRRSSVVTQAITKGLDGDCAVQDSGVTWLGHVPAHWQVLPLKRVGRATIGLTYAPEEIVSNSEQGTLVLRAGNIQDGEIVLEDNVYVSTSIPPSLRLVAGDILICSRNGSARLIGKNALIPAELAGQTWGAFMTVFRSPLSDYLRWVFSSSIFNQQVGLFATSTINQLTSGMLHDMQVPIPPVDEQRSIIRHLRAVTERIDALMSTLKKSITLAKEHRQALITAAVTGELDVPGAAA